VVQARAAENQQEKPLRLIEKGPPPVRIIKTVEVTVRTAGVIAVKDGSEIEASVVVETGVAAGNPPEQVSVSVNHDRSRQVTNDE